MTQENQPNPVHDQFMTIYGNGENLTDEKIQQLRKLDYSTFTIDQIKDVEDAEKLPDDLAASILLKWMRKQDEVLLNLSGKLMYSPEISKARLQEFVNIIRNPATQAKKELVVQDILEKISTGGGLREHVPLIDLEDYDNGIIRFDHIKGSDDSVTNVQYLLDFNPQTFYSSLSYTGSFIIIGFPSFMKVKLTEYKLIAPPIVNENGTKGGLKYWSLSASNDWDEIHTGNCRLLHQGIKDTSLQNPSSQKSYTVNSDQNDYFRFFKISLADTKAKDFPNHQNTFQIMLAGIDFSGYIILSNE